MKKKKEKKRKKWVGGKWGAGGEKGWQVLGMV